MIKAGQRRTIKEKQDWGWQDVYPRTVGTMRGSGQPRACFSKDVIF